ncbi:MAG: ABC transporter permease [Salinibacter sp.]|uniref:ABC transporter permease n=1 Tax=Salinibacter sp. TaxID=2065818 RepID=UPI0035D44B15
MFWSYLKTAGRTLWKHRGFTAINVIGLSVSLAVALLVLLFVRQQWRMDRFHSASEQIHRVTTLAGDDGMHYATSPRPLAVALRGTEAGAAAVAPVDRNGDTFVVHDESSLNVEAIHTDEAFWAIFDGFRFRAGTKETALSRPRTAVLSLETARRLYGDAPPVGKTFRHEGQTKYTVVGVLAPPEGPSHVTADVYLARANDAPATADPSAWERIYSRYTYVRLEETTTPPELQSEATTLFENRVRPEVAEALDLTVQSLGEMRFSSALSNEDSGLLQLPGWIFWLVSGLAGVALLAAGFNYVNLSVARSLSRAQEVGVRKTIGAHRSQLVAQFLGEAVLTALLASVGGVLLLSGLLPMVNNLYLFDLLGLPPLGFEALFQPGVLALILGIALLVGLLSGAYPAFVLSTYRPAQVLSQQGDPSTGGGSSWLRGTLITAQVAFTLILIVTATTMLRQTRSMATTDHHLQTDQVLSVQLQDVSYDRFQSVAEGLPGVEEVSAIDNLMLGPSNYNSFRLRSDRVETPVEAVAYAVDTTYVRDMGLPLRATLRNWDQRFAAEEAVILNRAAVQGLGFDTPEDILGASIIQGDPSRQTTSLTVVGVVENFDFTGSGDIYTGMMGHTPDDPVILYADPDRYNHALVRARSDDLAALRTELERAWTERLDTVYPFESRFYSDILRMRYGPLGDLASIVGGVALLAILIAALGLLSLAAYHVRTRTKEIGVRKALGASVLDVVTRLSRPFALLVAGAAVVAAPVAWILNRWWLQWMTDAVDVGVGVIALCIVGLVGIALLTVATQTVRAARIDPATTLRDE